MGCSPIVPRPPMRIRPKRRKGTESVVIFGVTLRITITSEGFAGTSLDVIVWMDYADVVILYKESLNEM
jgi:hypothetical protein